MHAVETDSEVAVGTEPAVCLVKGGEVRRLREQDTEASSSTEGAIQWRTVAVSVLLLCAALAGAVGIGSAIELSPRMWSAVAVGMSATAGFVALLPRLRIKAFFVALVRGVVLLTVLSGSLLAGLWVAVTPIGAELATAALCAPTLVVALFWPRHWALLLIASALVGIGALPGLASAPHAPTSYLAAATLLTTLLVGMANGTRGLRRPATPVAKPATAADNRPAAAVLRLARHFASHEHGKIAQVIVNEVSKAIGATGAILLLWDESAEAYRVEAMSGPETADLAELRQVELNPDWIARAKPRSGEAIASVLPNAIREPVIGSIIRRWHARAVHVVPFRRGATTIGVLLLGRSRAKASLSADDGQILSSMGPHAAAALAHGALITDLESANALKEEFMATMSHELRTPLNVIIGYTDMQIEGAFGDLDEEHSSTLQTVREQAVQLLELIQATLDMSRLERGLVSLDPVDIQVAQLLSDLQKRIPPAWRKPTVNLDWKIDEDLPMVRTDPSKLQILLRNLIHNAMKFTNNGLVLVSAARHPTKDCVTFLVQDSGVGIKAEHLSQIFDMFRQAPDGENHAGGVGLGLYIVKRLAAALGAEIEVSSAPGRGASFRIHLPLEHTDSESGSAEPDDTVAGDQEVSEAS